MRAVLAGALFATATLSAAPARAQDATIPLCLAAAEAANREPAANVTGRPAELDGARAALDRMWRSHAARAGYATTGAGLDERQAFAGALYVRLGCTAVTGALL